MSENPGAIQTLAREKILFAAQKRRIKFQITTLKERRRRHEALIIKWREQHRSPQTGVWDSSENKAFARTLYEKYGSFGLRIKRLGGERAAKVGRREFESG